ncbi:MAG TPA: hypothetical protein VMU84_12005 [Thermoanaerobaculia bacterium]|nr:hypothetical protein [Thermoanaerobaculia bacterium]
MAAIVNSPVIVDAGKTSRRKIKDLKQGCGALINDVNDAVNQVSATLGDQADGKQLIPVVVIYRRKSRRGRRRGRRGLGGLFPIPF